MHRFIVQIVKDGVVVREIKLADPTKIYCKAFNSLGTGLTARPHPNSRAIRLANSKRGSE